MPRCKRVDEKHIYLTIVFILLIICFAFVGSQRNNTLPVLTSSNQSKPIPQPQPTHTGHEVKVRKRVKGHGNFLFLFWHPDFRMNHTD